jgi:hypothetical protein
MDKKDCFGILDRVFPAGDKGLREVVPICYECPERVPCLRAALHSPDGIKMRAEMVDRAPGKGLRGRLRMWSIRKELHRMEKDRKHSE